MNTITIFARSKEGDSCVVTKTQSDKEKQNFIDNHSFCNIYYNFWDLLKNTDAKRKPWEKYIGEVTLWHRKRDNHIVIQVKIGNEVIATQPTILAESDMIANDEKITISLNMIGGSIEVDDRLVLVIYNRNIAFQIQKDRGVDTKIFSADGNRIGAIPCGAMTYYFMLP